MQLNTRMVQYVVDKLSSSSTSCLTDSLYQDVEDQEVSAWLEKLLNYIEERVETQVLDTNFCHHYNIH